MRRLLAFLLALVMVVGFVPAGFAEAPFVTIGFIPPSVESSTLIVRGTAPAGTTVAISINGEVRARVVAGPSMSVYHHAVRLDPGANQIVAAVEGTDARAVKETTLPMRTFSDLNGHWAKDDSEYLATVEVVNGMGDGRFGPDLQLTRAQFAKLIVLGLNLEPAADPQLTFTDTALIPAWARGYVATAVAQGLIRGFEDGSFGPELQVTRAQVAVIVARAARLKGLRANGSGPTFTDAEAIPAWVKADLEFDVAAGLIQAYWGERFEAGVPATRGLAAAIVRRLYTGR